ncbi:uncharacterized protein LOC134350751 [Mobula hypostoma]|uniref:uncharacterized protein LOC134350751 n=1 Tax=Mobula hypostoma TaxID=723540 RepID=UPI002FC3307A
MEAQMKRAQEDYKTNMDSIPVGWNAVGMAVVESLVGTVNSFSPGKIMKNLFSGGSSNELISKGTENNIISKAGTLQSSIQMLYPFQTHDGKIDLNKLKGEDGTKMLNWCKQNLEKFQEEAGTGGDCPEKVAALQNCKTGIGICEGLENLRTSNPADEKEMTQIAEKIRKVTEDTIMFTTCCNAKAGNMGVTATPPHMSRADPGEGASSLSTATLNARFKVEQSAAQLRVAQEMYDKSFENIQKNNKELQETLETLKNCQVQEIDFDKTVKMLLKGLDALGRVKEQWGKMVLFFTMMSNLIGSSLNPSLHKFIQYSEKISSGYSQNQLTQDLLYTQISQATNIASLVHMIAETYVQVSTHHLMDRVNSLGKLMGLDPNRDSIKFMRERKKFGSDCTEAGKAIEDLVKKNKAQYEKRVQVRIDRIHNSVMPLLPPATPEKMKEIEDTVKEMIQGTIVEITEEDMNDFV